MTTISADDTQRGLRPLAPDVAAKLARVEARQENRGRLSRIREAVARIEAELEHALAEQRRSAWASSECSREAVLLRAIESLAFDWERLEL
jgi:hypothetical protein